MASSTAENMASNEVQADDLETWLNGLGSLREKLLQQGLKSKEELLWLSQDDIEFGVFLWENVFCLKSIYYKQCNIFDLQIREYIAFTLNIQYHVSGARDSII